MSFMYLMVDQNILYMSDWLHLYFMIMFMVELQKESINDFNSFTFTHTLRVMICEQKTVAAIQKDHYPIASNNMTF